MITAATQARSPNAARPLTIFSRAVLPGSPPKSGVTFTPSARTWSTRYIDLLLLAIGLGDEAVRDSGGQFEIRVPCRRCEFLQRRLGARLEPAVVRDPDDGPATPPEVVL